MDYVYIISKADIKILDIKNVEDFSIALDSEYKGKSTVDLGEKPIVEDRDYLFLKHDTGEIFFTGIVESVSNTSGQNAHTLNVIEIENIFDRNIFIGSEEVKKTTGIEDFIKNEIEANFSKSNDALLNMNYLEIEVLTHTPVLSAIETNDGIYNFMTFLGNAREYYGIFLDFQFSKGKLRISISKKEQALFKFDSSVSDVDNYLEDYSVDALAKLSVKWKIPDTEDENGNVTIGAITDLAFFLRNDRTITSDVEDPDRASGSIDCLYIEKETLEEVTEEVINKFKGNSYEHSVTADVRIGSNIYPPDQFYIGHECLIKTVSHGVKDSIITKIEYRRDNRYLSVKFGNMAVTLIEKLRKEKRGNV